MILENFLKKFCIWAEFYQILAKDDRQGCQSWIQGVDSNFFETLFREKSLLLLVWILLEKTAKFPQINVVRVVAAAFYLSKNKKTQYDEKQVCFSEKTQFSNIFELWASSFGFLAKIIREHSPNCILRVPKSNWREKVGFEKFVWFYFGFLSKNESD